MNGDIRGPQGEAVRLPNTETLEAMRQVRERDGLTEWNGVEELVAALGEDDLDKFLPK